MFPAYCGPLSEMGFMKGWGLNVAGRLTEYSGELRRGIGNAAIALVDSTCHTESFSMNDSLEAGW